MPEAKNKNTFEERIFCLTPKRTFIFLNVARDGSTHKIPHRNGNMD